MLKTLGGNRLGSGNKMQVAMHNYERSTHNLSYVWRSTMAPGTLVPFCKLLALNGDTFTIDTKALVRTMPAIGPLFGSYKLQLDFFECPIRLYNGILHNNMTKIGMDMKQVKLPKLTQITTVINRLATNTELKFEENNPSSLLRYLGITGIGTYKFEVDELPVATIQRKFNAVPVLAYYDIFKNYYANKQEENAYVIVNDVTTKPVATENVLHNNLILTNNWEDVEFDYNLDQDNESIITKLYSRDTYNNRVNGLLMATRTNDEMNTLLRNGGFKFYYNCNYFKPVYGDATYNHSPILHLYITDGNPLTEDIPINITLANPESNTGYYRIQYGEEENEKVLIIDENVDNFTYIGQLLFEYVETPETDVTYKLYLESVEIQPIATLNNEIKLQDFKLDNIDDMRIWLLKNTQLGTENNISYFSKYPYKSLSDDSVNNSHFPLTGLVVKTYQSDMFNNWLSNEWVDGVKGINSITAVSTAGDEFTIDALNLANKVYNMLNRIAVSGGTYEDWQEAVYGEDAIRRAESPIYCGGASGIIAFEEVVSTADTLTDTAGDQPLGSLAGKGTCVDYKGGEIDIHVKEPSYIIGIASITPLIDYCQGNEFDMTELDSINDLHKPALDGIGFQDLMLEQAAYWTTYYEDDGNGGQDLVRTSGGKLPAWLNYMTNWNKVYGEFAEKDKLGYMVLTRDYEKGEEFYGGSVVTVKGQGSEKVIPMKDWTTYINPTKFNYQFADTSLTAQNFWLQIGVNIVARRKMSAKIIPNL